MQNLEFENAMAKALETYRIGEHPVVILSTDSGVIHGRKFLEAVVDLNVPMDAKVIFGIDVDQWNSSEWPEILEAARRDNLLIDFDVSDGEVRS